MLFQVVGLSWLAIVAIMIILKVSIWTPNGYLWWKEEGPDAFCWLAQAADFVHRQKEIQCGFAAKANMNTS